MDQYQYLELNSQSGDELTWRNIKTKAFKNLYKSVTAMQVRENSAGCLSDRFVAELRKMCMKHEEVDGAARALA